MNTDKRKAEILSRIKSTVKSVDKDAYVVLFGSQARNTGNDDSDWDIMILTPNEVDRKYEQKFRHKLLDVELEFDIPISTFVHSEKVWNTRHKITPLYKSISEEGIRL
jgi:predicted nucleotidyltransferase